MEIIKLYRNRKLYSTEESCYVTLNDLHKRVLNKKSFKVVTNRDGTDVTRLVLFKVLHKQNVQANIGLECIVSQIRSHPTKELK